MRKRSLTETKSKTANGDDFQNIRAVNGSNRRKTTAEAEDVNIDRKNIITTNFCLKSTEAKIFEAAKDFLSMTVDWLKRSDLVFDFFVRFFLIGGCLLFRFFLNAIDDDLFSNYRRFDIVVIIRLTFSYSLIKFMTFFSFDRFFQTSFFESYFFHWTRYSVSRFLISRLLMIRASSKNLTINVSSSTYIEFE